jgi:hypothetical protein
LTAKLPYKKRDYLNKDIHDTHRKSTDGDFFYPHPYHSLERPESTNNGLVYDQIYEIYTKIVEQVKAKPYAESKLAYEVFSLDCMITKEKKVVLLECNNLTALNMFKYRTDFEESVVASEISFIDDIFGLNERQRKLSIDNSLKYFDDRFIAIYHHQQAKKKTIPISDLAYLKSTISTSNLFEALIEANIPVDVWVYKKTLLSDKAYIDELIEAGKKEVEVLELSS